MIYVGTGDGGNDLSKFGGQVTFKVDVDGATGDLVFAFDSATSAPWKVATSASGTSVSFAIDSGKPEGYYSFTATISKDGTVVCKTKDPVIGNGID